MRLPLIIGLVIVGSIVLFAVFLIFQSVILYIKASVSGAKISVFSLIGMKLRQVDPRVVVRSRISCLEAGLSISTTQLEAHYLAGGNVPSVIAALIAAKHAQVNLTFEAACAMDLAGHDISKAVRSARNP